MKDKDDVDFFYETLLSTVVLVWLYGEEYSVEVKENDIVHWENTTTINSQGERWINYTTSIAKNVDFNGTYPNEDSAWGNSTFTASGELQYGDETNVLRKHVLKITYDLDIFNNDTKTYDTEQKKFRHELMVQYPNEVVKDTSLSTELGSGLNIDGFSTFTLIALAGVVSSLLFVRRKTRKK